MSSVPMQKRFWLFAGDDYYPTGGLFDFCGSYDTADEAHAEGRKGEHRALEGNYIDDSRTS